MRNKNLERSRPIEEPVTTIRKTLTAGLSVAAVVMSTGLVYAQTGTSSPSPDPALLKQIEEMQKQLDALKASAGVSATANSSQSSAAPAGAPKTETSAAAGIKMAEGWVVRAHHTKLNDDRKPIIGSLEEEPVKAFVLKETSFPLSKLQDAVKGLPQGPVYGYSLQGYFKAETEGKYGFALELTADVPERGVLIGSMNYAYEYCSSSVVIEGQPVIEQKGRVGRERGQSEFYSLAGSGTVSLTPGLYKVEATISCGRPIFDKGFNSTWALKVRQPDAMEPTVPKAGFVMHKLAQS